MKIKIYLLFFLFTVISTTNCFSKNYYIFKLWKSKDVLPIEKIYFVIDTKKSEDEVVFFETIFLLIKSDLEAYGFSCELTSRDSIENVKLKNELVLSFTLLPPAYVKLNTLEGKIPLCNRFNIKQIYPENKKPIETDVSISVDNEEIGIKQFTDDFSNKLLKNIAIITEMASH